MPLDETLRLSFALQAAVNEVDRLYSMNEELKQIIRYLVDQIDPSVEVDEKLIKRAREMSR